MFQYPNSYSRWLKALDDFIEYSISPSDYNESQEDSVCSMIRDTYIEIFKNFIIGTPGMDQWEFINDLPLAVPTGYAVNHYSVRYETEFSFGTDEKGFFLQIMLNYPDQLRKMEDGFWITVLELQHYGSIEFEQNRYITDRNKKPLLNPLKASKSQVFNLLRNSILFESFYGDAGDLGYLTVRWPLTIKFENLVDNGSHAFKKLLSLNLALLRKRAEESIQKVSMQ